MTRTPSGARTRDAVPPADVVLRAMRLDALLGDPDDPANPYGRAALATATPAPPADVLAELGARADAEQLVRTLRPLLRRDLGLAHAWAIRPLLDTDPDDPAAALLGPAALIAATGGVLRSTARIVDSLAPHEPSVRQWRPALAAVFADLLACECLTTVALRSTAPAGDGPALPVAAAGYLVPHLVGGLLADLELVLNESGFGPDTTERGALAALEAHRAAAGVDWTSAARRQEQLVRALPPGGVRGDCLAAAPLGTNDGDGAARAALGRVARRLATEQRAVHRACGAADPADPAARSLADRFALLLLASAALGVARAAADTGGGFLGGPDWVLLALERVGQRLGVPLPEHPDDTADPRIAVWTELTGRTRQGIDCDVYATRLLW